MPTYQLLGDRAPFQSRAAFPASSDCATPVSDLGHCVYPVLNKSTLFPFATLQVSIWRAVAEDFAPFNVDVTTEEPASVEALRRVGTGDTQWGIRVVIGGSCTDWYSGGCGGVAYLTR
jgi:hypothetical protein